MIAEISGKNIEPAVQYVMFLVLRLMNTVSSAPSATCPVDTASAVIIPEQA